MYRLQTDILDIFPSLHDVDNALHHQIKNISFLIKKARLTSRAMSSFILGNREIHFWGCAYPPNLVMFCINDKSHFLYHLFYILHKFTYLYFLLLFPFIALDVFLVLLPAACTVCGK